MAGTLTALARPAARLDEIHPSPIRKMFDRAAELTAEGKRIYHLEIGRPDFDTPEVAKRAAAEALQAGEVHYGPNAGTMRLRTAIAEYLAETRGARHEPDGGVIVTVGANEAVFLAIMAFCQPGDEVIVPVPAWAHYRACIRLAGAVPVEVPLDGSDGYRLDRRRLAEAVNERTRMVIVCTPNNPTGTVMDHSDMDAVAELLEGTDALLLSDEIYADLVYGGARHVSACTHPRLRARTLTVGGFAKAFAMDGWRLGWLAGPPELIGPALRVRQYTTVCPTTFTQAGAAAALGAARGEAERMRSAFEARRDAALETLRGAERVRVAAPDGAFYLYLDYSGVTADRLALRLLEEQHVAVVPGTAFDPRGGTQSLRISYACSVEDLTEGLHRIIAVLDRDAEA